MIHAMVGDVATLHLSKVAVGCASLAALENRVAARQRNGAVEIVTRYRPKRAGELTGGSLYWIVRHRLVARQEILGFGEAEGRTIIRLDSLLVPVRPLPMRAHQGWRYLREAPADLAGADDGEESLPPELAGELAALALI